MCDDGDVCNGVEICNFILGCVLGESFVCDDGDVCNGVEGCDISSGCVVGEFVICVDNIENFCFQVD